MNIQNSNLYCLSIPKNLVGKKVKQICTIYVFILYMSSVNAIFFFTTTLLPNSIRIGLQNKYFFFLFKLQYDSCGIYICSLAQLIRNSKKMIFCDL